MFRGLATTPCGGVVPTPVGILTEGVAVGPYPAELRAGVFGVALYGRLGEPQPRHLGRNFSAASAKLLTVLARVATSWAPGVSLHAEHPRAVSSRA
jgi:hypothetical protein